MNSPHSDNEDAPARQHGHRKPAWYLVQCRPRQEERALEHLRNQDFRCFLPRYAREKIRAGRRTISEEPLFPGYAFIQLSLSGQSWHSIRSTRGVRGLVRFGQQAVPVPDDVVEQLSVGGSETGETDPLFRRGDRLRIKQGPFVDLDAVFDRFEGDERVIVLLNILQKEHALRLNLKDIEPA